MRRCLAVLFTTAACGGGEPVLPDGGGQDAAIDVVDAHVRDVVSEPDAPSFVPAAHGAFPQDITNGGTVLTAPKVIPVFFQSDALETTLETFLTDLAASGYWTALSNEYGVGALTVAPSIVVTDAAPNTATATDVANYIKGKLDASDPAWPAAAPNNIYLMYYPSSTTLYLGSSVGCSGFAGYHSYWQTTANAPFVFVASARCDKLQTQDVTTQNTSHELVEATTDPFFATYAAVDPDHAIWGQYPGRELGDMCEVENWSYQRLVGSFLVARFWSNKGASTGHDPCAPSINMPYYNSVPVLPDTITVTLGSQPVLTKGVSVPLGQTKTIDVQLFSDAPAADWTLQAQDSTYLFGTTPPELQMTWDVASGNNGDVRKLTITRLQNSAIGGTEFVVYSRRSGTDWHAYFGVVGN